MDHVKPNGTAWRLGRGRQDLSAEEAAVRLGIKPNPLRNIESNQARAAVSLALALRASQLYETSIRKLVVGWYRPAFTASKDEWAAYAVGEGVDFATASRLSKAELVDLLGGERPDDDEPEPEAPKPQDRPRREPSGDPSAPPPRRNGKHGRTGPRRDEMRAAS